MKVSEYTFPSEHDHPLDHQIEMFHFYLRNKRGFNLSEMGTSKTLATLWTLDFLLINQKIQNALISAPLNSLELVWVEQILNNLPHLKFSVLHGHKAKRLKELDKKRHIYIINHDGVKVIERQLIAKKFDIFITDELTAYKNWEADRTKSACNISHSCRAAWGITGSPTADSPLDSYGQAKVINKHNPKIPPYFKQFRDEIMIQLDTFTEIPRVGWEDRVAELLSPAIRFKFRECVDIPPTVEEDEVTVMSKEQEYVYNEMHKKLYVEYQNGEITAANAGVKISKLLQISAGAVYDSDRFIHYVDCTPKLTKLLEIFKSIPNKKLIVFAQYKAPIEMICKFFNNKGIKAAYVHGGIPPAKRPDIYRGFIDRDTDVIVLQPGTSAHALTLVRASTIVWFSPTPSGEKYEQANARIVRPGQERSQLIIRLRCSRAENHVYTCLTKKDRMSKSLLKLFEQ